jgi:hypothetical protein
MARERLRAGGLGGYGESTWACVCGCAYGMIMHC